MKKFYDEMNEAKFRPMNNKDSMKMAEVEYLYQEMFEDARFALESIIDNKLLPQKQRSQLQKMMKDLDKIHKEALNHIGETQ